MRNSLLGLLLILTLASLAHAQTKITHGPMLGRLDHGTVAVWARTKEPGKFHVVYGSDEAKLNQKSSPVQTQLADDCTGWVQLEGLKADTKYFYKVIGEGAKDGPGGAFITLPDPKQLRDPKLNPKGLFNFRFEFACGNNQNPEHGSGHSLPAFQTMNEKLMHEVNFAILNGDWLYEEQREYPPSKWIKQVGASREDVPHVVKVAPTITGVWENYKLYLSRGKPLSRWHANTPYFFTLDDHEILNDIWGAGQPGLRDRRAVFRDIGVHAWHDYLAWANPTEFTQQAYFGRGRMEKGSDVLFDERADFNKINWKQAANLHVHWGEPTAGVNDNALDEVGGIANAGTYRIEKVLDKHRLKIFPAADEDDTVSYSIGRRNYFQNSFANCDFFYLDTRSHRDMHDVRQPDKPGLTMLGMPQRQWLYDGIKKSKADFIFVVSSVNLMIPHVGGGKIREGNKEEAWTGFLDARDKLIDVCDRSGKKVFFLTGDLHNSFVIRITDNVWEFGSGPHNSNNHWYTDEGDRPATGRFKFGPTDRVADIRWSSWYKNDIDRGELQHPIYTVIQVNNVFNNPLKHDGPPRWIAFERPQVIIQYFHGRTGDLLYADSVVANR